MQRASNSITQCRRQLLNMALYLVGVLILVGALAYGATQLGVSAVWIGVGAAIIVGIGIMSGVSKTQRKE